MHTKWILTGLAGIVLAIFAGTAQADSYSGRYRDHGRGYETYGDYHARREFRDSHRHYYGGSHRHGHGHGHWDYIPGHYHRHHGHWDYHPGHYEWHEDRHHDHHRRHGGHGYRHYR